LDGAFAWLAGQVPALRDRHPFWPLPEDAQPLPGLQPAAGTVPRRRCSRLLHHPGGWPRHRAAGARPGALRRPSAAVVSCTFMASTLGIARSLPAPAHKRHSYRAVMGAPDTRSQNNTRGRRLFSLIVPARQRLVLLLSPAG